jgi:hypothetical protein
MAQIITPYPVISSLTTPLSTIISASALQPSPFNPFITNSVIPNIGLSPIVPAFPNVVTYQDVNNDRHLKAQVLEYFYNKLLNNWLKYHFIDLYYMITISNGKAMLIKNINDIENNKKNERAENDIKYEYLIDNYLSHKDVYRLLSKFRKMNNLNWWELKQHSDEVRLFIHHKVKQYIKYEIMN